MLIRFYLLFFLINFAPIGLCSQTLSEVKEELKTAKIWHYPYPELIDYLEKQGKTSILIFSYGSLMDAASASQTLSAESMATRRPALAYGLKRVFDRDVPIRAGSKWCIPIDPLARGMLNVLPSGESQEYINGVLIDVSVGDIPHVLFREEGYDLIPVIVQEWDSINQATKPSYEIAYTFYAPQNTVFTNATIKPRPHYYELTRDAAKQYGVIFSRMWFETTFYGDGKTPIGAWEKKVLAHDQQAEAVCQ